MLKPSLLNPFKVEEQRLYSELLPLSLRLSPATFWRRLVWIHNLVLSVTTQICDHRWWLEPTWTSEVRLPAQLLLHHNRPEQRPLYCWRIRSVLFQRIEQIPCLGSLYGSTEIFVCSALSSHRVKINPHSFNAESSPYLWLFRIFLILPPSGSKRL